LVFFFALAAAPIRDVGPASFLWTAPLLLLSAMLIAWAAESAQFFIAQGFALAILAWLQTLPEFAVEAVLAWKQQTPLLFANLSGALRMLTGLGWPMIYFAAASVHRKRTGTPLRRIVLDGEHSVQVIGLLVPLLYMSFVWWKDSLNLFDAVVLTAIYGLYLYLLSKMPPQEQEAIDELEFIPRTIVLSPRRRRIALITAFFVAGGALIYFIAEPFLGSLMALATAIGVPNFVFIQWIAPIVSEFPEMASTFYFARTVTGAPMALMNMVSSNINQWTLLVAMLPVVFSLSVGAPSTLVFDPSQELEILMTISQALVGMLFLVNMELAWWEAVVLFVLYLAGIRDSFHWYITVANFAWAGVELIRLLIGQRKPAAFTEFVKVWREHHAG
jgi:cation:H+ antiporter